MARLNPILHSFPTFLPNRQGCDGRLSAHLPQGQGHLLAQDALLAVRMRMVAGRGLGRKVHEVRGSLVAHAMHACMHEGNPHCDEPPIMDAA